MRPELSAAVERPVIGEHQEPRLKRSFVGIELPGCAEQVQEHLLDRIFSIRVVAKDSACDLKYDRAVTLEEYRQGVGLIGEQI